MTVRPDDFTLGRPVLVGLDNPYSRDPADALSRRFSGSSGARLFKMSGLTEQEYDDGFAKVNVLDEGTFREFLQETFHCERRSRQVVVLGRDALRGFPSSLLCGLEAWFDCRAYVNEEADVLLWLVPHPGGLNRLYNDEATRGRLEAVLRILYRRSVLR